jgi:dolichol-phosphate mannosyltransferase
VIRGFLSFAAVCAVGAAANVGAASFLMASASCPWWLAGLTGILIGAVWNYGMSSHLTWRSH